MNLQQNKEEVFEDSGGESSGVFIQSEYAELEAIRAQTDEILSDSIGAESSFEIFHGRVFQSAPPVNSFGKNSLKSRMAQLFEDYSILQVELDAVIKVAKILILR